MAELFDQLTTRRALAKIGKDFHRRGWMAGTAGNLSARSASAEGCFWITSSGLPKGQLDSHDFILVDYQSNKINQRFYDHARPSAETCIHSAIYNLFPHARACFHIHSVDACITASRISSGQQHMPLPPLEMIKGLDIWQQNPEVSLSLFDNLLDIEDISRQILTRFRDRPPVIPALMIRDHGMTVWGNSLQQTYNRVEIIEFIISYMAQTSGLAFEQGKE